MYGSNYRASYTRQSGSGMEGGSNYQTTVTTSSIGGGVSGGNFNLGLFDLTDREGCKMIARKIFDTYDRNRDGTIDAGGVSSMISDAYKFFNKSMSPDKSDTDCYTKVIDRNKDGRVTYDDIEKLCEKYLMRGKQESLKKKVYSADVEARLELARRLFKQIDADGSGHIGEKEVPQLLIETYKSMGVNNYQPTNEDVKAWMDLTDTDNDGLVSLEDYEDFVIRSLMKAGFKIDGGGLM